MARLTDCDILVVGAGPAGSSAAAAAANSGARTILIDAKARIGEPLHCGEFVPQRLFSEFPLDRGCIVQPVEVMETQILAAGALSSESERSFASDQDKTESLSPGFLIDRVRFDRALAWDAAVSGAAVLSSARLVGRDNDAWIVRARGAKLMVRPRFVIAADGAVSSVATLLGMGYPELLRGVQLQAPLRLPLDRTFVFLSQELIGGYGWLFPKGKMANVGLGVVARADVHPAALLEKLAEYLLDLDLIRPGIFARWGGSIPVSGTRERLVAENVIFCGDAAGMTHPITGAGIPQAVVSGTAAGLAAAQALETGTMDALAAYEKDMRTHYRGVLDHALSKRRLMMSQWDNPDFEETCRRTWIAFDGYKKRKKEISKK
jgi:geranylgeranyl reductase family protein